MGKEFFIKLKNKYTIADLISACCGALLAVILILIIAGSGKGWWIALIFSCVIMLTYVINSRFVKKYVGKSLLFAMEYVLLFVFCMLCPNNYLSTAYSIMLIDFYMHNTLKSNCVFGSFSYVAYAVSLIFTSLVMDKQVKWAQILTQVLSEFILFFLVFAIANMLAAIIRKNKEIIEREKKLQEAYASLKELTKIEERNRIAKQIHDTVGHSITTVIMQTEAAKLMIDTDPESAKNKIVSANMQAVTALEELRKSVRVLSGDNPPFDLVASINKAINETTEGTGVAIRAKIGNLPPLGYNEAFFIYSSLKEGLNNGIRHGKSTAFYFELKVGGGKIKFLLSDNGNGGNAVTPGFGLKSMKKNAEKYGGKAEFSSTPGEGFEIRITLPTSIAINSITEKENEDD